MGKNAGIIYALKNELWGKYLKCGLTTQKIEKRISNLQTSLFIDCEIVSTTDQLINCKIYEYILHKILNKWRVRSDREFFDVDIYSINNIFDTFNWLNNICNTEDKLNYFMKFSEYFDKKKLKTNNDLSDNTTSNIASNKTKLNTIYCKNKIKQKLKKKKGLYVDTRY